MRFVLALAPWLELFTLIQLGITTSALTALGYVFLTMVLGFMLIRRQGAGLFEHMRRGEPVATRLLLDDMTLGLAGLLLMFPGLISDLFAVIVLIGPLRRRIVGYFRPVPEPEVEREPRERQFDVLEGEYTHVNTDKNP
jgi:UPF0716 protein FxsA